MIWIEKKIINQNNKINIFYTEFTNGTLIFITDSENKIGTIGIGVPLSSFIYNRGGATNPLVFGVKNELITKTFARKIAEITNKIVIAILNLSENGLNSIGLIVSALSEIWREN